MKNIVLDFGKMADAKAVHAFLREATESEEYFGSNLDAMFDVLSTIGEETCITVIRGGKDFEEKFISVMKDAAEEQGRLTIREAENTAEEAKAAEAKKSPAGAAESVGRKENRLLRFFKESRRKKLRKKS